MIKQLMRFSGIQVAVAGVIRKNGRILITKRSRWIVDGNKWCLPGGHVEKGETAQEAVKREIKEEIGFDVKRAKLLFVHEEFVKRLNLHAIVFVFLLDVSGVKRNNWEVNGLKWIGREEINKFDFAFTHKDILEKFWRMK